MQTRELNKSEMQNLEEVLQKFCMKHDEPKLKLKYALTFVVTAGDLGRSEMEKWSHVESRGQSKLWDLPGVVEMCDRRLANDYCTEMKIFKNLIPLCNSAQNTEVFVLCPLVKVTQNSSTQTNENAESKNSYESQDNERTVPWESLELAAVCLVEFQRTAQCQFDELHSWPLFDERFTEQLKKLKEVGIDLKLEKAVIQRDGSIDEDDENIELVDANKGQKKEGKVIDYFGADLPNYRYRTQLPWHGRKLSLRNALELTIAYSKALASFEKAQFFKTITCLDLCDLKISKLDGIENLASLHCLNLANNRLTTVKKLRALKGLTFLDISGNCVAKIDDLPPLINELRASRNTIACLGFCTKLQLLTHLNVAKNKIKSLKGIELSKLLQIFIASDNQIKLTNNEIEVFANFPKLCMVDLIGNPVVEADGYRKRLLCLVPGLLSVDYEKVPVEERSHIVRKSGKVLTFEFIEKLVPELEKQTVLNLDNQYFQMIALDRNSTSKLQHITELNMSHNSLEHIYELVDLKALKKLNLAHNQIVELCSSDLSTNQDIEILPELEELDLSFNNLNCPSLARIGLEKLSSLRRLLLNGNQLSRFDGAQFDFPNLEEIDASQNEIRSIRKKTLSHLLHLNLADNRLKELEGLEVPKIQHLNLANNRIGSCAALKNLKAMKELKSLNCSGNPVTERRVYLEFIKGSLKNLEELDSASVQRRSQSITPNAREPMPTTQRTTQDSETRSSANLPPLVKLANSQSSDVRRYNSIIQKSISPSMDSIPQGDDPVESLNGKVMGFARVVQRQSTLPTQTTKAQRSQSIESTKLDMFQRSKSNFSSPFVIAGTRAVKHLRIPS